MTDETGHPGYPVRVFDVAVHRIQNLSPNFRRITFAGPDLDRFGVRGPTLDLRIKLLLPVPGHDLSRPGTPDGQLSEGWYQHWLRGGQPGRGVLRSCTVRALRTTAQGRELDVDIVLHPAACGHGAPGSDWARTAAPGTAALIIGPDCRTISNATPPSETGIRWDPQRSRNVLLAGDETAVPAISAILETLPAVSGSAFLEVPDAGDVQDIRTRANVRITWLARNPRNAGRGELLVSAIEQHCGQAPHRTAAVTAEANETYAWIGAEAGTVKTLRRYLVKHLGMDPRRSELRGYWSAGKSGSGIKGMPLQYPPPAGQGNGGVLAEIPARGALISGPLAVRGRPALSASCEATVPTVWW